MIEKTSWSIERWVPPRRDRDGNIIAAGRWIVFTRACGEADAEETLRRVAKHGGIARATSGADSMLARPDTFVRWNGSGGKLER